MEGEQPQLGDLLTIVINHWPTGMILQVVSVTRYCGLEGQQAFQLVDQDILNPVGPKNLSQVYKNQPPSSKGVTSGWWICFNRSSFLWPQVAELQKQIAVLDQDSNKATLLQLFHRSLVGGFCREVMCWETGTRYDFYGSLLGRRISHNSFIHIEW